VLTYFAARTERVSLGTMVVVVPWWNRFAWPPDRLSRQHFKGPLHHDRLGRGVAKSEFDAVGVPREESRERLMRPRHPEAGIQPGAILYNGKIFKIPEMSIRPAPRSTDCIADHMAQQRHASPSKFSPGVAWCRCSSHKPIEDAGKEFSRQYHPQK